MKQNTKKDYYEEDDTEGVIVKEITSAIEMQELIEQKMENVPAKGKLHSIWKKETNSMIEEYNTKFGHVYNHVK